MRVALYYPWIHLPGGAERTILELTGRSRHRFTIFTHHLAREMTFEGFAAREIVELGRIGTRRSVSTVAGAALRVAAERLPMADFDALIVVSEGVGDLIVFRNSDRPILCICLTPLRIAFDEAYRERYLASRDPVRRAIVRAGAAAFRRLDALAWRRYAHILCISEEARRRAAEGGLARAEALEIQHVGLGFEPEPDAGARSGDYFLLPGRVMWTKNVELGIRAYQRMKALRPELARLRLVVAGVVDAKSEEYFASLRALAGDDPGIEFHRFPSDAALRALYRGCLGVLFTAFNEDWGIIPLEAMAFGKPVIATNRGGPRESVEHGVNGFLEEPDAEAFAQRMAELAGDPVRAREIGAAGPARARLFSWERFTERVDARLDALVGCQSASRIVDCRATPALGPRDAGR